MYVEETFEAIPMRERAQDVNVRRVRGTSLGADEGRDLGWACTGRAPGRSQSSGRVEMSTRGDFSVGVERTGKGAGRVKFEGAYGEEEVVSVEEYRCVCWMGERCRQ